MRATCGFTFAQIDGLAICRPQTCKIISAGLLYGATTQAFAHVSRLRLLITDILMSKWSKYPSRRTPKGRPWAQPDHFRLAGAQNQVPRRSLMQINGQLFDHSQTTGPISAAYVRQDGIFDHQRGDLLFTDALEALGMAPDNHTQRPINDDTATAIDPARRTVRTLRPDAAAVLGDSANERSRARGSLKRRNEPRILVYDAEQLIERRRMRDRRL